jgi:hypothetical protein
MPRGWRTQRIPLDIRIAAMNAVKYEWRTAVDVATQYGISSKSICGWLKQEVQDTGVDHRWFIQGDRSTQKRKWRLLENYWRANGINWPF